MSSFDVRIVSCGSPVHLADLRALRERQLAIPHDYSTWPLHSTVGEWLWCRVVDARGGLITGFAVNLTSSRAIPGTRIGRVNRIGRNLHEDMADVMGAVLSHTARKIPRLLRLDARLFDEEPARRQRICDSLRAADWNPTEERREYSQTLVLQLAASHAEVLKGFSTRVRSTIKKALGSPALRFAPISGSSYADRVRYLYALPFARTGGVPPEIDVEGIMRDSASGESSLLIGAFSCGTPAPEDLLALVWGRLHGDHAVVEINASERTPLFNTLSPGFGLMSQFIDWTIQHHARWIDLGGLSSMKPEANDPMRGIIEFKTRFSSDFRRVAEEWHFAPSPMLAAAAVAVRSIARRVRAARHTPTEHDQ
jgi:FemAB family